MSGFLEEQGNSAAEYLVTLNRSMANLKNEYQLLQSLDLSTGLDRNQKHELMLMAQKDRAAAAAAPAKGEPAGLDSAKSEATEESQTGTQADVDKAEQDLQALTAQRDDFAKVLRPQHPTMVDLNAKIDAQKRLIETLRTEGVDEMKTREESLRLEIDNLQKTITEWEAKAIDVGRRMADYNRIKDKVDRAQEAYKQQSTNLTNIDLDKNVDQNMVTVLEHASDPRSVRPGLWRTMALAAVAGLLLGLAALAVLARLDDRILTTTGLESLFNEQLLAQIPRVPGPGSGQAGAGAAGGVRCPPRIRGIAPVAPLFARLSECGRRGAPVIPDYERRAARGKIDRRIQSRGNVHFCRRDGLADRWRPAPGPVAHTARG